MDFDRTFLYSMKESAIMSGVQENDITLMLSFSVEYPNKIPEYIRNSETGEVYFTGEHVSEIKPCYEQFSKWLEEHYDEHGRRRYIKEEEEDIEMSLDSNELIEDAEDDEISTDSTNESELEDLNEEFNFIDDEENEDNKKKKKKKKKSSKSNFHDELAKIEQANKEIERLTKERNDIAESHRLEEEKRINTAIEKNERIIRQSQEKLYTESHSNNTTENDKVFLNELSNKYKELEEKRIAQEKATADTARRLEESRANIYAGSDNLSGEQFYTKAEEYDGVDFSFAKKVAAGEFSTQTAVEVDRVLKGLDFSGEGNHYSEEQAKAETEKLIDAIEQDSINRRIIENQQSEASHLNPIDTSKDTATAHDSYHYKDTYHSDSSYADGQYQEKPNTYQHPSDIPYHKDSNSSATPENIHKQDDYRPERTQEGQTSTTSLYSFNGDFNKYAESQTELLHTLKTQADELQAIYKKEADLYRTHSEYIIESAIRAGNITNLYDYEKEQISSTYQKSEEAFSKTEKIYSYIREKEDTLYIDEARYKASKAAEKYEEGINYDNFIQYGSPEAEKIKSINLSKQYTESLNKTYIEASNKIQNYYGGRERIVSFTDMEMLEKERLNAARTKEYELIAKQDIYGIKSIDSTLPRDEQIKQIKEIHELSNEKRAQATQKYNEALYAFSSAAAVSATDYLRQQTIKDIRTVIKNDENKETAIGSTIGSWETIQLNEAKRAFDFQQKQNASVIDSMADLFKNNDKNTYTFTDSNREGTLAVQKSAIITNAIEAKNLDTYNRAQAQAIINAYVCSKALNVNQTPAGMESLKKDTFNKLNAISENIIVSQTNCVKNFADSLNTLNRQRVPSSTQPVITVLDTPDKIYAEFNKMKKGYEKATKKIFFGAYEQNNNIAFGSSILNELDDLGETNKPNISNNSNQTDKMLPASTFKASRNSDLQPGSKTPNNPSNATAEITYERGSLLNLKALENIATQARRSINSLGESAISGTDFGGGLAATTNFIKIPLTIAGALAMKSYLRNFNTLNIINKAADYATLSADMSNYINAKIKSNLANPGAVHYSKRQIAKLQNTPPLLQKDALKNMRDMVSLRFTDEKGRKLDLSRYTKKQLKDLINDGKAPAVLREAAKFELLARNKSIADKSMGKNKVSLKMFIKSTSRLLMNDDAAGEGFSTVQRLARVTKTSIKTAYKVTRLSSAIVNKAVGDAFTKIDEKVKEAIIQSARNNIINPARQHINRRATQISSKVVKPVTNIAKNTAKKVGGQISSRITSTTAFTSARARINSTKAGFNRIKTKFSGSKIGKATVKTGKTVAKGTKTAAKAGEKAAKAITTVTAKIGETVANFISKVNKITLIIAAIIIVIILIFMIVTTLGHLMVNFLVGTTEVYDEENNPYLSKAYNLIIDDEDSLEAKWDKMLTNSYTTQAKKQNIKGYNDLSDYNKEYYENNSITEIKGNDYKIETWGDLSPYDGDYPNNAQIIKTWNGDGHFVSPGDSNESPNIVKSNIKTIISAADYKASIADAVKSSNAAAGFNIFEKDFSNNDYKKYCESVFKQTHLRYLSNSDLYTCTGSGYGCGDFLWYCNDTKQAHDSLKKGSNIILYDKNNLDITDFKELRNTEWYCGTSEPNHYYCSGCQSVVCCDGETRKCCPGHPYLGTVPISLSDAKKANPRGTFVKDTKNDSFPNTVTIPYEQKVSSFTKENDDWINTGTIPTDVLNGYVSEGILKYNDGNYYFVVPLTSIQFTQLKTKLGVYNLKTNDAINNIIKKLNANPENVKNIKFDNALNEDYIWTVTDNKYTIFSDNERNYINGAGIYGTVNNDTFTATISPDIYTISSTQVDGEGNVFLVCSENTYKPYHTLCNGTRERCTASKGIKYVYKNVSKIKIALLYNNTTIYVNYDILVSMCIPYSCPGCTYEINESQRVGYYTYCPGHTGTYCHGHTKLFVDSVTLYASDKISSGNITDMTKWPNKTKELYTWSDGVPIGFKINLQDKTVSYSNNVWKCLSEIEGKFSTLGNPDYIDWLQICNESKEKNSDKVLEHATTVIEKETEDWGLDYYGIDFSNERFVRKINSGQFITDSVDDVITSNGDDSAKHFFSVDQLK